MSPLAECRTLRLLRLQDCRAVTSLYMLQDNPKLTLDVSDPSLLAPRYWHSSIPCKHGLVEFQAPHPNFSCNHCGGQQPLGEELWGCRTCSYDVCVVCIASFV